MNRLLLGPIVGHTDHESTRIWIRIRGNPADFTLRVVGIRTRFSFQSTEDRAEFGTAVAVATRLRAETDYRYVVHFRGRGIALGQGHFRTMPPPGSMAEMLFVTVSCSDNKDPGAWFRLRNYIRTARPRFLLMIGDQVYQDESIDDRTAGGASKTIWNKHLDGDYDRDPRQRRRALAETYQRSWSREPIREVLANIPVYMMWDDHDIRDGWGSWSSDSPVLAERFPAGRPTCASYQTFFEDARDVFWHFQRSHYYPLSHSISTGIPSESSDLPGAGGRRAMPMAFQCGRLAVLVLDSRGIRDLWRARDPILGEEQWRFIQDFVDGLPRHVDAVAIVTTVPIVAVAPDGIVQSMLGYRDDDVDLLQQGENEKLRILQDKSGPDVAGKVIAEGIALGLLTFGQITAGIVARGREADWKLTSIDDARDQWSHRFSRPEQERLIRLAGTVREINRAGSPPRSVFFIGGDLHSGGRFQIDVQQPPFTATCLITSGIAKRNSNEAMVGILVDKAFEVAPGIHASLQDYTVLYNFGVTRALFTGGTPEVRHFVAREGDDMYMTLKLS